MKKIISILVLSSFVMLTFGQENTKQREVGITFENTDNFGFTYRFGTDKALWRVQAVSFSGGKTVSEADSSEQTNNRAGVGIKIGRESRRRITDKLEFRMGADLLANFARTSTETDDKRIVDFDQVQTDWNLSAGIGGVVGFNYVFDSNFVLGVELLPFVRYQVGQRFEERKRLGSVNEQTTDTEGFVFSGSTGDVIFSIVYRF